MKSKKTKFNKRLLSAAAAVLMVLVLLVTAVPAQAANTPVNGEITTFNKYLTMSSDANVPNVTFNFTIGAGNAVGNTAIVAGIVKTDAAGKVTAPTVSAATFAPTDTTTEGLPTDSGTATSGQKYVAKKVTVDFSGISFENPGIYRYTITETNESASGITYDTTRTLDVYVGYKRTGGTDDAPVYSDTELEVQGYYLQNGTTKSDGFTNEYATNNLTLAKEVTGNQGNRNKEFTFTVTIANATAGTKYTVVPAKSGEVTELVADTNGSVTGTFTLKHNERVVIKGLAPANTFAITETDYSGEGYTTSYKLDSTSAATGREIPATSMNGQDHTAVFTNSRQGSVPTGILLDVAPYLILGGLVLMGLILLVVFKRRRAR